MRDYNSPFDPFHLYANTERSKRYLTDTFELYKKITEDTEKTIRLQKQECLSCFYILGKIGGSAMTSRNCACCGIDQMYGSTCTDMLCMGCAKEGDLCKHCGADIKLRVRRKDWPKKKLSEEDKKTIIEERKSLQ